MVMIVISCDADDNHKSASWERQLDEAHSMNDDGKRIILYV